MTTKPPFHSDRPADKDLLRWSNFTEGLARSFSLPEDSESIVVGIEGEWGSGKSTLIGLIKKSLSEENPKPIIIEFNPWMVSGTEALVETLIIQIAAGIRKSPEKEGWKTASKLLRYAASIKHLKFLKCFPGTGFVGNLAEEFGNTFEEFHKTIEKSLSEIDISERRSDVIDELAELGQPLIIIVDDIDRLPPEEIRSIIQTIKAVVDFPRTLYLLAYDRSIVARALGSNNEKDGDRYLEKIVQVAYPIPMVSQRQLKKFAEEKISILLTELEITLHPFEESRYESAIDQVASLSRHMRDIVRLVNRLLLILPATHKEVDVTDAIVFETLSQRFSKLRKNICVHPVHFVGGSSYPDPFSDDNLSTEDWIARRQEAEADATAARKDKKSPWAKFLPEDSEEKQVADSACRFLFSSFKSGESPGMNERRMANPNRMVRYLRRTAIDGIPDAEEIHDILSDPVKLEHALSVSDNKELSSLLGWLFIYTPSWPCSALEIESCIEKLIDKSQHVVIVESEITKDISRVMWKLLQHDKCTLDTYNKCLPDIIEKTPIHVFWNFVYEAPEARNENFRNSVLFKESTEKWIDRARKAINGELDGILLHYILFRIPYLQNGSYEEVHAITSKMCETDDGLDKLLSGYDDYKNDDPRPSPSFFIIKDPEHLASRIEKSSLNAKYYWLIEPLKGWKNKQNILARILDAPLPP
ncbi:hypothetical protein D8B23_15320 [Verminephrobacter aporrectodeae subsp. tuberculatae]|uniref:KAP family P-loop NTPase fold protein n=1 Tax=Verminephrobacter aporrectodeae TaxID=1110389 RepID=UPI002243973F|nr:P-loop NTPase fold protein [Verminephrobacter aporrectodeae]MCW8199746.1 hypothetical protein [Verminephrobacter aporrectodeae subsp. tuberculatae]